MKKKILLSELLKVSDANNEARYIINVGTRDNASKVYLYTEDEYSNMEKRESKFLKALGVTKEEIEIIDKDYARAPDSWLKDSDLFYHYFPSSYSSKKAIPKEEAIANSNKARAIWQKMLKNNKKILVRTDTHKKLYSEKSGDEKEYSEKGYTMPSTYKKNAGILVDTDKKEIDFSIDSREFMTRTSKGLTGRSGTLTQPSGDVALSDDIQVMKKVLGFLLKNDKRVTKSYTIIGNPQFEGDTIGDLLQVKDLKTNTRIRKGQVDPIQQITSIKSGTKTKGKIYLYHGTSDVRWKMIQDQGKMKGGAPYEEGYEYIDLTSGWSDRNIYLGVSQNEAENYASRQYDRDSMVALEIDGKLVKAKKAVVLRIEVPDPSKLVMDEDTMNWNGKASRDASLALTKLKIPTYISRTSESDNNTWQYTNLSPQMGVSANSFTEYIIKTSHLENRGTWFFKKENLRNLAQSGYMEVISGEKGISAYHFRKDYKEELDYFESIIWGSHPAASEVKTLETMEDLNNFAMKYELWDNNSLPSFIKEFPKYLSSKEAFVEWLRPMAEMYENIVSDLWLSPEAAIKSIKRGVIAYRGEIPVEYITVAQSYKPGSMKEDPEEDDYNKKMDKSKESILNYNKLSKDWEKIKSTEKNPKKTKDMKKFEKETGQVFEGKYSLKRILGIK